MSGTQKSIDVQAIKTRQIVVQEPSGLFPAVNSLLTVRDGRGHTEWTTDVTVDSLTANTVVVNDELDAVNIVATNIATTNLAATNIAATNIAATTINATEIDAADLYAEVIKGITGTFDNVVADTLILGATGSVTYEGGNTLYVNGAPIQAVIGLTGTYYSDYIYWNTTVNPPQWSVKSTNYIHLGSSAGEYSTPLHSVAVGQEAGLTGQSDYSIAIGSYAGNQTQGSKSIAIGMGAGSSNQTGSSIAVGYYAGEQTQGGQCVAVGEGAGQISQNPFAVAVGFQAGNDSQGSNAVAIGWMAGYDCQGNDTVAIGYNAGYGVTMKQYDNAIAIGSSAGYMGQNGESVAIGYNAGYGLVSPQGGYAVAIGSYAGYMGQNPAAVALGYNAGYGATTQQGSNAIAIGSYAGYNSQDPNTIILNATGADLSSVGPSSLYINPIRNVDNSGLPGILRYNPATSEVVYDTTTTLTSGIAQITNTGLNEVSVVVTGVSITSSPVIQLTFFNDEITECQNPVNPALGNQSISCWYNFVSPSSFQINVQATPEVEKYFKIAWSIVKP